MTADTTSPLRFTIHVSAGRATKETLQALRAAVESWPGDTPAVFVVDGEGGEHQTVETRFTVEAGPELWNALADLGVLGVDLLDSSEAGR